MHYWDTSTLAKLYVQEPDSQQFEAHLAATGPITTSALTRWELLRLLARKESDGRIPAGTAETIFKKFLEEPEVALIKLISMDAAVEDQFRSTVLRLHRMSPPLFTRTLDGIHIATAELNNATEFVATDTTLRKSAAALGLKLFP